MTAFSRLLSNHAVLQIHSTSMDVRPEMHFFRSRIQQDTWGCSSHPALGLPGTLLRFPPVAVGLLPRGLLPPPCRAQPLLRIVPLRRKAGRAFLLGLQPRAKLRRLRRQSLEAGLCRRQRRLCRR